MSDTKNPLETVLTKYPRAIAHMRAQRACGRLGLVFGAGASRDLGFPNWTEFVKGIASHKNIMGQSLIGKSKQNTTLSQQLFQKYKETVIAQEAGKNNSWIELNAKILAGWRNILRDVLYRKVPTEIRRLKEKDKYLSCLIPTIKNTPVTVTYNFDDTLEQLLGDARNDQEKKTMRGYKTMWGANVQPLTVNGVIYHPNGYLPRHEAEPASDDLVFLEDSFGDQLIESVHGHYAALASHYSYTTCLFVGVSLEDATLKHLLRISAKLNPGHVHYLVRFLEDGKKVEPSYERYVRDSDFDIYNLIPLFLQRSELAALGNLLDLDYDAYRQKAHQLRQPSVYRFFLTGSVSVGKTTAISHFRSLITHDEWLEPMVSGMEKDPSKVNKTETIKKIDQFIVDQWCAKNLNLAKSQKCGINIIDRTPLDAFAFTPKNKWVAKAQFTRHGITGEGKDDKICKGALILLIGDPRIMAARATRRGKDVTPKLLRDRQELLKIVFQKRCEGVRVLDTTEMSAKEVAKEIARMIHLESYNEFDFDTRLDMIEKGKVSPLMKKNAKR